MVDADPEIRHEDAEETDAEKRKGKTGRGTT